MSDPKNAIDKLFDIADGVLDSVDKALKPASPKQSSPADDDLSDEWEAGWTEPHWGPVDEGGSVVRWHAFRNGGMMSVCTEVFTSHQIQGRRVLEHGKTISACSSCIIGICKS